MQFAWATTITYHNGSAVQAIDLQNVIKVKYLKDNDKRSAELMEWSLDRGQQIA